LFIAVRDIFAYLDALCSLARNLDIIAQPSQAFEDALTRGSARGFYFPEVVFGNVVES
jgi:hypothetical protein